MRKLATMILALAMTLSTVPTLAGPSTNAKLHAATKKVAHVKKTHAKKGTKARSKKSSKKTDDGPLNS